MAYGTHSLLLIVSYGLNKPLVGIFGYFGCWINMSAIVVGALNVVLGGCGQAIFRLISVQYPHHIRNQVLITSFSKTHCVFSLYPE